MAEPPVVVTSSNIIAVLPSSKIPIHFLISSMAFWFLSHKKAGYWSFWEASQAELRNDGNRPHLEPTYTVYIAIFISCHNASVNKFAPSGSKHRSFHIKKGIALLPEASVKFPAVSNDFSAIILRNLSFRHFVISYREAPDLDFECIGFNNYISERPKIIKNFAWADHSSLSFACKELSFSRCY